MLADTAVDLAGVGFSVLAPEGLSVQRDELNEESGIGISVIAASDGAPITYTFRDAPLPEDEASDLAAMDDEGRKAFAQAVLGECDDAEVKAFKTLGGNDGLEMSADGGKLFAIIVVDGESTLSCYATSDDGALTEADKDILTKLFESANG